MSFQFFDYTAFSVEMARDRRPSKTQSQQRKKRAGHKPALGSWPARCSAAGATFGYLRTKAPPEQPGRALGDS